MEEWDAAQMSSDHVRPWSVSISVAFVAAVARSASNSEPRRPRIAINRSRSLKVSDLRTEPSRRAVMASRHQVQAIERQLRVVLAAEHAAVQWNQVERFAVQQWNRLGHR